MNNDFDRKPEEGAEEENPIRRGYDAAPTEEPAPAADPAPAEEKPEYRFKAETPAGAASTTDKSGNEHYYYDYTSSMKSESETAQNAPKCAPEEVEKAERASTISLVMGIIGVALIWMCCGAFFASLLVGVIGLVYSGKSCSPLTGKRSGKGTTGFVLSLISTILGALAFLFWILYIFIFVVALASGAGDVGDGEIYIRAAIDALGQLV